MMQGNVNSDFVLKHLTVSYDGVVNHGRYHTLLTSAFMHGSVGHLAGNLISVSGPPSCPPRLTRRGGFRGAACRAACSHALRHRRLQHTAVAARSSIFLLLPLLRCSARRDSWQCT